MDGGSPENTRGEFNTSLENLQGWRINSEIALWSLILLGAFFLNATLLFAFLKKSGLRTISNRFVMNLAVSNLLTSTILNSLLIIDRSSSATFARSLCLISEGATALVTTSSVLSVLLIAIDQYFAVVDPLRYRTRVDKLKCGLLILSVWSVAALFGMLATLNPNPRSLWKICNIRNNVTINNNATTLQIFSTYISRNIDLEDNEPNFKLHQGWPDSLENSSKLINALNSSSATEPSESQKSGCYLTYGLIYTVAYTIFAYLLPFIGICWIYISIYTAARKNSERTRRTGSRPILSSGSFCEEYYYPVRQDALTDEFRRIPKISSLSSIDESIETAPSQMVRSKSSEFAIKSDTTKKGNETITATEEKKSSAVIFTLGSRQVDVTSPQLGANAKDDNSKVPIATLRAEFLEKTEWPAQAHNLVKSKFPDTPAQRRKSSYDLMYEEIVFRRNLDELRESSEESCSDVEDGNEVSDCDEQKGHVHQESNSTNEIDVSLKNRESFNTTSDGSSKLKAETMKKANFEDFEESETEETPSNAKDDMLEQSAKKTDSTPSMFSQIGVPCTPTATMINSLRPPLHRVSSVRSTSSYINSLKHRISNASLFKYREETRAARISALVIVMGLICWTPHVVILIMRNLSDDNHGITSCRYNAFALSFLTLSTYVSPLLFGYRSKRVKRELRRFFCFRKELSYKNNRSLMAKKVLKRRYSGNGIGQLEMDNKYNIFNCVYGKNRWPKEKVQFVQVPDNALAVETCRSSFSSGASTQISTTSTDEC